MRKHGRSYVAQHHIRYSSETDDLLQEFGITPIVLTRDLKDSVASLRDHLRRPQGPANPLAWATPEHAAMPDADLDEFIADHVMPWYVQFAASWQSCERAVRLTYDDVTQRPEEAVSKIVAAGRIEADAEDITVAVGKARRAAPRFNKGVPGRGKTISVNASRHIDRLLSRYPELTNGGVQRAS
jgi:hypothetical protein